MIVSISGTPGSGKSTVAKIVAKELGLTHHSAGDFMREMAEERGISLMELSKLAETNEDIDKEIDERNKRLAEEDGFVIDSRLAFHFIPKAVKIFLKVSPEVAAKRIWSDVEAKRRTTEKEFTSEEQVLEGIKRRLQSETQRYQDYYGINYLDESNFDFVLDTDGLTVDQVVERVVEFVKQN